jgi:hypothetical protein
VVSRRRNHDLGSGVSRRSLRHAYVRAETVHEQQEALDYTHHRHSRFRDPLNTSYIQILQCRLLMERKVSLDIPRRELIKTFSHMPNVEKLHADATMAHHL